MSIVTFNLIKTSNILVFFIQKKNKKKKKHHLSLLEVKI